MFAFYVNQAYVENIEPNPSLRGVDVDMPVQFHHGTGFKLNILFGYFYFEAIPRRLPYVGTNCRTTGIFRTSVRHVDVHMTFVIHLRNFTT